MSGVGVMIAAMMKMMSTAYLNLARRNRSVTSPSRARKKMRIGSSKQRPRPN